MTTVAKAQITDMNFPSTLIPGDPIAGTVTLKNIGDESTSETAGFFGVLVKTLWDGVEYPLFMYSNTAPGEIVTFTFPSLGVMPEGDAVLNIIGRTWLGDTWRKDDEKNLYLAGEPPAPEPKPLAPLILIAGLAFLLLRRS